MTATSIVDLFKNSKPRSKLFTQLIPPGFSEEDFKELIKEYLNDIDYIVFRPGKIIRDPYGHLIGLDCPNYGFATINFKNPRSCPKFHREFHQFPLSDSFNIKSKLFIEFALMQQVPETLAVDFESKEKENFRDLTIFKEFLKTFPFAAKAEEDRLNASGPIEIDLEDEMITEQQQQVPIKISELDAKLSISISEVSPLPQVSFSSLLAKNNSELISSTEAVTPLTEYIKKLALHDELPPADKDKERQEKERKDKEKEKKKERKKKEKEKEKEKKERKRKEKEKKKKEEAAAAKNAKADKNGKPDKNVNQAEKKNKTVAAEPLVEKQSQAPPIKGIPKILARKPANETKEPASDPVKNKQPVPSARQPYIPPAAQFVPSVIQDKINPYESTAVPKSKDYNDNQHRAPNSVADSKVKSSNNERPKSKPKIKSPNNNNNSAKKEEDEIVPLPNETVVDILFRMQLAKEAASASESSRISAELVNAEPFIPSAGKQQNSNSNNKPKKQPKGKTLAERSAKPSSPREPYIRPDLTSEPVAAGMIAKEPTTAPKKILTKTPESQQSSPQNSLKKVFTSSAKMRESKQA